jgi:histone H3/H4
MGKRRNLAASSDASESGQTKRFNQVGLSNSNIETYIKRSGIPTVHAVAPRATVIFGKALQMRVFRRAASLAFYAGRKSLTTGDLQRAFRYSGMRVVFPPEFARRVITVSRKKKKNNDNNADASAAATGDDKDPEPAKATNAEEASE